MLFTMLVIIMENSSFLAAWILYENRIFDYFAEFTHKTCNGAQNMEFIFSL